MLKQLESILLKAAGIDDMPLCNWKKCDAAIFSNEVGATKSINTERGIALIAIPQKQTLRNMKKKKGEKLGYSCRYRELFWFKLLPMTGTG